MRRYTRCPVHCRAGLDPHGVPVPLANPSPLQHGLDGHPLPLPGLDRLSLLSKIETQWEQLPEPGPAHPHAGQGTVVSGIWPLPTKCPACSGLEPQV